MFGSHGTLSVGHVASAVPVPWQAVALMAAAGLTVILLRRGKPGRNGGGTGRSGRSGRSSRSSRSGNSVVRALGALGAGSGHSGPPLRVLSRLTLGPGRYLCTVEAGDRVILVAVGGEVKLMGEVQMPLPRSRRRRHAVAHQLLVDQATAMFETDADADTTVRDGEEAAAQAMVPPAFVSPALTPAPALAPALAVAPQAAPAPVRTEAMALDAGRIAREDEEDAAYFTRLLSESMARMQAADARLARRPRSASGSGRFVDRTLGDDEDEEESGA